MCLAIPVRVVALLDADCAEIEIGGVRSRVSTALVEQIAIGDYLIVHAGFAISRLDVLEAEKTLALFAEIAAHHGATDHALHSPLS